MQDKKNILVLTDWYLPAFKAGGPVRSVAALVHHLRNDFNFYILTSNKDAFDEEPLHVRTDEWVTGAYGEQVCYLSGNITKTKLAQAIEKLDYDLVYINSFFSKPFSIYPLMLRKQGQIRRPVVLAPRGMLREGALAIKPAKKKLFLALTKLAGLHKNVTWHATSQQEVDEIRKIFGDRAQITLASNLTLPPLEARSNYEKEAGHLKVCSVTRIVRNKKIDLAIEALKAIQEGNITFDIYGPAEDERYLAECRALTQNLRPGFTINFKGVLLPHQVESTLKQYHVFLLPTETENFGHAIVEAMLNGCIPVISNNTPWQGLEARGLGWDLPLEQGERFTRALHKCLSLDGNAFRLQSIKIQQFAHAQTSDPETLRAYEQLFK